MNGKAKAILDETAGTLDSINGEAGTILDEIAFVPDEHNHNIDPTLNRIEGFAKNIREHVNYAEKVLL